MNLMQPRPSLDVPTLAGPLYLQVAEHMRTRVKAGEWSLTQALPNEGDLASHYRVSLGTMRKALEYLVRQKLVVRLQGRGTYVMKNQSEESKSLGFFRQEADLWPPAALDPKIQFVSREKSPATSFEAPLLKAAAGVMVERITFVTRLGDVAKSLDTAIFLETSDTSRNVPNDTTQMLSFLADVIRPVAEFQDHVEPALASPKVAGILGIPAGTPVLLIARQAVSEAGNIPIILRRVMFAQKQVRYSCGNA